MILEEEVTEFLGRVEVGPSLRGSDHDSGYRNGYSRPRKLTLSSGTIEVSRPRVRNAEDKFESRLLPLFTRRTNEVSELRVPSCIFTVCPRETSTLR